MELSQTVMSGGREAPVGCGTQCWKRGALACGGSGAHNLEDNPLAATCASVAGDAAGFSERCRLRPIRRKKTQRRDASAERVKVAQGEAWFWSHPQTQEACSTDGRHRCVGCGKPVTTKEEKFSLNTRMCMGWVRMFGACASFSINCETVCSLVPRHGRAKTCRHRLRQVRAAC